MAYCRCVECPVATLLSTAVNNVADHFVTVMQGQRAGVPLPVTGLRQADWCAEGGCVRLAAEWHFKQHKHCPGECTCCACCAIQLLSYSSHLTVDAKMCPFFLATKTPAFKHRPCRPSCGSKKLASLHDVGLRCDTHIDLLALYTDECLNWF